MKVNTKEIYSEVYSILNLLGEEYIKKLPISLFNMIKEERNEEYNPEYDFETNLEEMNIKKESLSIIALFYLNYWCDSEEDKEELKELFKVNEEKYQIELNEKYNTDNLFKKEKRTKNEEEPIITEVSIIKDKESFLKRIINKIKNIFKKRNSIN